jgi:hypothetical protein
MLSAKARRVPGSDRVYIIAHGTIYAYSHSITRLHCLLSCQLIYVIAHSRTWHDNLLCSSVIDSDRLCSSVQSIIEDIHAVAHSIIRLHTLSLICIHKSSHYFIYIIAHGGIPLHTLALYCTSVGWCRN